ncbi:hypothetical protein [Streptomyces sp. NPDC001401]|uniref:hypothetical protein n=1 Tax=Streptomyces sp. NPDC001401 TaxID=3364570 RepID=UPI003687B560
MAGLEMFGFGNRKVPVISDIDAALRIVRDELEQAGPEDAPGLRRALAALENYADHSDPVVHWACDLLDKAGIDPHAHPVAAIKRVREELPGVGLASAKKIVDGAVTATRGR